MQRGNFMISIIIPTYKRPYYLNRAIQSVLSQTYQDFEIITIIDGEDQESLNLLKNLEDKYGSEKIKYNMNVKKIGGNNCRNQGFNLSEGDYIALMDDDDEWIETKLEKQMGVLEKMDDKYVLNFTSCFIYKNLEELKKQNFEILPRRNWDGNLNVSNYLFKTRFLKTQGLIQTSTIIVSRAVFEKVKFTPNLLKHQDWDWLINIFYYLNNSIKITHLNEPLVIYHSDAPKGSRLGGKNVWNFSLNWVIENKKKFTKESFNEFITFIVLKGIAQDKNLNLIKKLNFFKDTLRKKDFISWKDFIILIIYLIK